MWVRILLILGLMARRSLALLGSTFVNSAADFEVFLITKWSSKELAFCTGTVISQGVVITAAHCIYGEKGAWYAQAAYALAGAPLQNAMCMGSISSTGIFNPLPAACAGVSVASCARMTALNRDPNAPLYLYDLALLQCPGLRAPAVPLLGANTAATFGQASASWIMGYGLHSASETDYSTTSTVQPLQWGRLTTLPDATCAAVSQELLPPSTGDKLCGLHSGAAPCFGDSGGGVFVTAPSASSRGFATASGFSLLALSAVVSSFKDTTLSDTSCLAAPLNFLTKIGPYTSWINSTLRAWGAPAPTYVSPSAPALSRGQCAFSEPRGKTYADPWVLGVDTDGTPYWCGAVAVTRDAVLTTASCITSDLPPYGQAPVLLLVTDGSDPQLSVEWAIARGIQVTNPASARAAAHVTSVVVKAAIAASPMAAAEEAAAGSGLPAPMGADLALLVVNSSILQPQPLDSRGVLGDTRFKSGLRLGGRTVTTWPADICTAYSMPLRRSGVACLPLPQNWSPCSGDAGRPVRAGGAVVALQSTNVPEWAHIWAAGGSLHGACENTTAAVGLLVPVAPSLPWLRGALLSGRSNYAADLATLVPICT
jgi:hypothetical protein